MQTPRQPWTPTKESTIRVLNRMQEDDARELDAISCSSYNTPSYHRLQTAIQELDRWCNEPQMDEEEEIRTLCKKYGRVLK